jgi:hypothetical protein
LQSPVVKCCWRGRHLGFEDPFGAVDDLACPQAFGNMIEQPTSIARNTKRAIFYE